VLGSVPKGFIAGQNASQYKPSNPSLPKPDILAKILLNADLATQQISEASLLLLETCLFGEWTKARLPTRPALLSAEKYRIAGTLITNRRRLAARSSQLRARCYPILLIMSILSDSFRSKHHATALFLQR
jgi:hypothetical protein